MTTTSDTMAELAERDAWLDLFEAAPEDVRSAMRLASTRSDGMGLLACGTIPINEMNRAMGVGIDVPLTDESFRRTTEWFASQGVGGWAIQVSPSGGSGTVDVLSAHGAAPSGNGWAKFVLTKDALGDAREVGSDITLVKAGAELGAVFGNLVVAGFGMPEITAGLWGAVAGRRGWTAYLATMGGEHVGAGAMYMRDGRAWFGIDTTLPAFRGRGVQQALIASRVRDAVAAGATVMTAETGQPATPDASGFSSFRNYRRAGFTPAYNRPNYKLPAPT